jgi:anaerobic magnesium-protoporphyrin IX monomethyl ester cyclase
MASVLLTHSYHLANDPKQLRKMQPYAPLGTLYAAAALRAAGISVAVFDTTLQSPADSLARALRQHRPRIVVIYEDDFNFLSKMCLSSMRETARTIARIARNAGAAVIAHGSDATDHAEDYLDYGIDFVLTGEAEQTVTELCTRLLHRKETSDVPGLVRKDSSGKLTRSTTAVVRNSAWNHSPRAARELIDLEPYRAAWTAAHGLFSANVVASRGCPFQCNWCAKPISGNKFQARPAEDVAAEIRELKTLYGAQHIWFGDDVFALNHRWTEQFADAMQRHQAVLPFKIQSRADLMSAPTVDALQRAGCAEVWMGVESGSQKILDAMDKGLLISEVIEARDRLQHAGIRACFFLQFGYPGETWEDIQSTISLVRATRPDDIGVSVSYPLPGTVFYDRVHAQIGAKRNWTDSDDLCIMFTAAYTNDFYVALRDALHLEVTSWRANPPMPKSHVDQAWRHVRTLERTSHNANATEILAPAIATPEAPTPRTTHPQPSSFVPLQVLTTAGGRA